jgi:hypothetical protein
VASYIKALEAGTASFLAKSGNPTAKGILIAVGVKSGKRSRIWCQAIEGSIPVESLRALENKLAEIVPMDLKQGPVAFALEMDLGLGKAAAFPEFPDVWLQAATKNHVKILAPPDELFGVIWPDGE